MLINQLLKLVAVRSSLARRSISSIGKLAFLSATLFVFLVTILHRHSSVSTIKRESQQPLAPMITDKLLNDTLEPAKFKDPILEMDHVSSQLPYIYVITPTHTRLVQKAELTRLSQTLRLVPNVHWIVVEDSKQKSRSVTNFLSQSQLSYTHLNTTGIVTGGPKRGVPQRNAALKWLRENAEHDGVVYFADDDNTYDVRIFEEMRFTKNVSVWPVGLLSNMRAEGCIVKNGTVTGWYTGFMPGRKFPVDMAGFAVNLRLIQEKTNAWFNPNTRSGVQETDFLSKLGTEGHDLEPKADNCTKVYVWHTRTIQAHSKSERLILKKYGLKTSLFEDV